MSSLISCRCLRAASTWGQGVEIILCLDEEGAWEPPRGRERQAGLLLQGDWGKNVGANARGRHGIVQEGWMVGPQVCCISLTAAEEGCWRGAALIRAGPGQMQLFFCLELGSLWLLAGSAGSGMC